jgi:hypothetical protein
MTHNNQEDISLEELTDREWLTVRTINICKDRGLTTLNLILDYYNLNGTFKSIKNCGNKTDIELIEICKKYNYQISNIKFNSVGNFSSPIYNSNHIEKEANILNEINSLSPFQRATLNRHFEYLFSNLSIRSINGITKISNTTNFKEIFETIFSNGFKFNSLKNIGNKSLAELEKLKQDIVIFIYTIKNIDKDNLSKEYSKLIIKAAFKNISNDLNISLEKVFDENGKIKLFALINQFIETGSILNGVQKEIFKNLYCQNNSEYKLSEIAKELGLSKERVRQIKSKMIEDIEDYFLFVTNFNSEIVVNYNLENSSAFFIMDGTLIYKINKNENVNYNLDFYKSIFSILLRKTYYIIYNKNKQKIIVNKQNNYELENCYFINYLLIESFDFDGFINDIYWKLKEKITETYQLNFQGYLYNFIKNEGEVYYQDLKRICEVIILNEFELIVSNDGYVAFERNKSKPLFEYFYEILHDAGKPLSLDEISLKFSVTNPHLKNNIESIRSCMNKERNIFICFGRSSTYGLRIWEKEKDNIKGGTIRDIVEDYLNESTEPRHIFEITMHVKKFRTDTYQRSIIDNLRMEINNRFVFFNAGFIGLKNKVYSLDILNYKSINGGRFTKNALKPYNNWDYDKLINHLARKFGYHSIQIKCTLESKLNDGEIIIDKNNKIKL